MLSLTSTRLPLSPTFKFSVQLMLNLQNILPVPVRSFCRLGSLETWQKFTEQNSPKHSCQMRHKMLRPRHQNSPFVCDMGSLAILGEFEQDLNNNMELAECLKNHAFDNANLGDILSENDQLSKEKKEKLVLHRRLQPVAENVKSILEEMQELKQMIQSQEKEQDVETELLEMAKQDLSESLLSLKEYIREAAVLLLPEHAYDSKDAVLEVLPGAGGNEASHFAEEVFNLYLGYSNEYFKVEVTSVDKGNGGEGILKACATVKGLGAFRYLKYECGVHRVQRVPKASTGTKSDRLQTSTCSVAVLPKPDQDDQEDLVPESEMKIEFMRSSGAGGQNVNKLDSACRATHIPTGVAVKCQEQRSQHQNKAKAIEQVRSILYQQYYEEEMRKTVAFRKSQIGNMNRNEKIRTYNFTRNMIIDHRIVERGGSRQVPDLMDFFSGKLGYAVLHGLRQKLEAEHQFKSLYEFLTS